MTFTMKQVPEIDFLYDTVSTWYAILPPLVCPLLLVIDAPFGRFTPKNQNSWMMVDGIKSWIIMELVSPAAFLYTFMQSPLSSTRFGHAPPLTPNYPPTFLAGLFLTHYLNRALISPLRTPSRSKSNIIVPLAAIIFNIVNGSLMGTYLSSPLAHNFTRDAFSRPLFWLGIGLWALGFVGNIWHDEILLNIRREAKAEKARDDDGNNGKNKQEHYAIPYGFLYKYISYPNYFCEWMEWLGFALAAGPLPSFTSFGSLLTTLTPPYLFLLSEVFLMIPRAYKGHKWYHNKFPDYPKNRKVVIPFLF